MSAPIGSLPATTSLAVSIHHAATAAGATTIPVGSVSAPVRHVAMVEAFVRPTASRTATPPAHASDAAPRPEANAQLMTVTVERGDSAWSLAEKHLGEPMRWRELWDLNRHTVQPDPNHCHQVAPSEPST